MPSMDHDELASFGNVSSTKSPVTASYQGQQLGRARLLRYPGNGTLSLWQRDDALPVLDGVEGEHQWRLSGDIELQPLPTAPGALLSGS
jgi:hypothetical protein